MADTSSGRDTIARENISTMSSSKKANIDENGTACDNRSTLLTDMLNCSNSMENDEFVALFTSQGVSTSYESQPSTCIMPSNFVCLDSSITMNNEGHTALDQMEIDTLDSQLQNLPKEIYISKLLDLCSNDESMVCWYRNSLCLRARKHPECPQGKLFSRKTTKSNSSTAKYAKDCYILYMFLQGEKSCINEIFDKNKGSALVPEMSKVNTVEIKVAIQTLMQRVTNLEEVVKSKEKTIDSLASHLKSLQSEHEQLYSEHERLKAESMSRFTKYDSFQKLTTDNIKRVETEQMDYKIYKSKINDELKRLSKVSINFQKQMSALSPRKSYASTLNKPIFEGTEIAKRGRESLHQNDDCSPNHHEHSLLSTVSSSTSSSPSSPASETVIQNTVAEKVRELRAKTTYSHSSHSCSTSVQSANSPSCTPIHTNGTPGSDNIKNKSTPKRFSGPETPVSKTSRSDDRKNADRNKFVDGSLSVPRSRSVEYNGASCMVTLNDKRYQKESPKQEEDIFIGVTYRKTARYYLSGIDKTSSRSGIANYIERKGVKITHLMLFKPKFGRSRVSAKVNVPLEFATTVESPDFWPDGVRCRQWVNNREWEQHCATHSASADRRDENDDNFQDY